MLHETLDRGSPVQAIPLPSAVVVSGDALIGQGLARLIERAGVAGSVTVADSFWAVDRSLDFGLAVLHVPAIDAAGLYPITHLVARRAPPTIVAVVPPEGHAGLAEVLAGGAHLVVSGRETPDALRVALAAVDAGFRGLSADLIVALATRSSEALAPQRPIPLLNEEIGPLTPRQRDVATLIAEGLPTKLIAARLGISAGTVKIHTTAAYRAYGVSNRAQLTRAMLVSAPPPGHTS